MYSFQITELEPLFAMGHFAGYLVRCIRESGASHWYIEVWSGKQDIADFWLEIPDLNLLTYELRNLIKTHLDQGLDEVLLDDRNFVDYINSLN